MVLAERIRNRAERQRYRLDYSGELEVDVDVEYKFIVCGLRFMDSLAMSVKNMG
jgi:hypothetical protein